MANKRTTKKNNRTVKPAATDAPLESTASGQIYALRETIESIVIAFVLAFLFRTFEAEAFKIPTGSMSPALQGQHKDVDCTECGYRFRTTASSEGDERQSYLQRAQNPRLSPARRQEELLKAEGTQVLLGVCPMCRQTMAMRSDLPPGVPDYIDQTKIAKQSSYPGDRILVNKFTYNNRDPDRWDVIVFKFPGNGEMNYIKRLIGLPNETLQIYQGDIFIQDNAAEVAADFYIERKPPGKVKSMLQSVHDTDFEASMLYNAGWPLRWAVEDDDAWEVEANSGPLAVQQQFHLDAKDHTADAPVHWLRYHHLVPQNQDWTVARKFAETSKYPGASKEEWLSQVKPELIRDFNPYNAERIRGGKTLASGVIDPLRNGGGWEIPEKSFGMHWVGDLAVRCEIDISKAAGELHLDLVEAGQHFTCRIDLQTGEAQVGLAGNKEISATVKTKLNSPGQYQLLFANVDDQLLLWIDDELVELTATSSGLTYDADQVFGTRSEALPTTGTSDLGDLAPVGIGASGATISIKRIEVLRDIYYIATNPKFLASSSRQIHDYSSLTISLRELFTDSKSWSVFSKRRKISFPIAAKQLFVMGDNSPASQDCRLWSILNRNNGSMPGGPYLDQRLLIGKAICVFWPHSWGQLPGPDSVADKLPGFPSFGDMRLVR